MDSTDISIFNQDKYIAHYTNFNSAISILDEQKIRLSHKSNTNDLYENNKNWFFDEAYSGSMSNSEMFECGDIKKKILKVH